MTDECITKILVAELDNLYKQYLFYRDCERSDLALIYSEKMHTVMLLAVSFGVWDKIKPVVDDRYKL